MRIRLVDASGFVFQAFHSTPPMQRSDGVPVNAVYGFCNTLWRLAGSKEATHLAVVFDAGGVTFRNAIYPLYKATRPPKPEAMVQQLKLVREATRAFNIPFVELAGYEADDLVATYTRLAVEAGGQVEIVSSAGDKDLMQLVGGPVTIWSPHQSKWIGPNEVEEKFGVPPERLLDVLALVGDASDNVPGVPTIGLKTAAKLIRQFGDLDGVLENVHRIDSEVTRNALLWPARRDEIKKRWVPDPAAEGLSGAEKAILSRRLIRLDDCVPVEAPLDAFERRPIDPDQMCAFLEEMEFSTMASDFRAQLLTKEAA